MILERAERSAEKNRFEPVTADEEARSPPKKCPENDVCLTCCGAMHAEKKTIQNASEASKCQADCGTVHTEEKTI